MLSSQTCFHTDVTIPILCYLWKVVSFRHWSQFVPYWLSWFSNWKYNRCLSLNGNSSFSEGSIENIGYWTWKYTRMFSNYASRNRGTKKYIWENCDSNYYKVINKSVACQWLGFWSFCNNFNLLTEQFSFCCIFLLLCRVTDLLIIPYTILSSSFKSLPSYTNIEYLIKELPPRTHPAFPAPQNNPQSLTPPPQIL